MILDAASLQRFSASKHSGQPPHSSDLPYDGK